MIKCVYAICLSIAPCILVLTELKPILLGQYELFARTWRKLAASSQGQGDQDIALEAHVEHVVELVYLRYILRAGAPLTT